MGMLTSSGNGFGIGTAFLTGTKCSTFSVQFGMNQENFEDHHGVMICPQKLFVWYYHLFLTRRDPIAVCIVPAVISGTGHAGCFVKWGPDRRTAQERLFRGSPAERRKRENSQIAGALRGRSSGPGESGDH